MRNTPHHPLADNPHQQFFRIPTPQPLFSHEYTVEEQGPRWLEHTNTHGQTPFSGHLRIPRPRDPAGATRSPILTPESSATRRDSTPFPETPNSAIVSSCGRGIAAHHDVNAKYTRSGMKTSTLPTPQDSSRLMRHRRASLGISIRAKGIPDKSFFADGQTCDRF